MYLHLVTLSNTLKYFKETIQVSIENRTENNLNIYKIRHPLYTELLSQKYKFWFAIYLEEFDYYNNSNKAYLVCLFVYKRPDTARNRDHRMNDFIY